MAEEQNEAPDAPKKSSKFPLLAGLALALVGGGGGFFAANAGLVPGIGATESSLQQPARIEAEPMPDIAFVEMDQMVIAIGAPTSRQHLIFRPSLEVPATYESEVAHLVPRVADVINSYLRAVDIEDLEDPTALMRLRSQMLRRVQLVTGEGRVNDLLVMEFVLN